MPKTKLTPVLKHRADGEYILFMDEKSDPVDDYEDKIMFVFNIAPKGFSGSTSKKALDVLKNNIDHLIKVREIIETIHSFNPIRVESNFYWDEGDLNIELSIPKTHPLFTHLFIEP